MRIRPEVPARLGWLAAAIVLTLACLPAYAQITPAARPVNWPPGPGARLVSRCLICHNGEMVASQRLTPDQWSKEVAKMTGWGAPLDAAEQKVLAAYLASHYGPDVPPWVPSRVQLEHSGPGKISPKLNQP